jgi:hypothetical protein
MRLPTAMVDEIDRYVERLRRSDQPELQGLEISRTEAIRSLIVRGLKEAGGLPKRPRRE